MATATHTATNTPTNDIAQKFREQLISSVQQGQKLTVDAAQTLAKAVSVLPVPDLPKFPGLPAAPSIEATTKYSFDVATDLLNAQRTFALQLTDAFAAAKSS